ncbi:hypothetical protein EON66_01525 [archaeon]|nr:MAG: hypothetical protein EON66_01525 [archaeon]
MQRACALPVILFLLVLLPPPSSVSISSPPALVRTDCARVFGVLFAACLHAYSRHLPPSTTSL